MQSIAKKVVTTLKGHMEIMDREPAKHWRGKMSDSLWPVVIVIVLGILIIIWSF